MIHHPTEAAEEVGSISNVGVLYKAGFSVVIPRTDAIQIGISCQDVGHRTEIVEEIGSHLHVLFDENHLLETELIEHLLHGKTEVLRAKHVPHIFILPAIAKAADIGACWWYMW